MGCTQSTAKEPEAAPDGAGAAHEKAGAEPQVPGVVVNAAGPNHNADEQQAEDSATADTPPDQHLEPAESPPAEDTTTGSSYVPPPGGRTGHSMVGGPPTNLAEVPGEPADHGRVARPAVTLKSGAVYEGQWKVRTRWTGQGLSHHSEVQVWP